MRSVTFLCFVGVIPYRIKKTGRKYNKNSILLNIKDYHVFRLFSTYYTILIFDNIQQNIS